MGYLVPLISVFLSAMNHQLLEFGNPGGTSNE